MKFRFILALGLVLAGLFLGLGAAKPAHAATAVQLTATDQANLQAVLNLTKVALDAIQVQADRNAIQNPAAMIVTLNGIKSYLITIRGILGGNPVATAPVRAVPTVPVVAVTQPSAPQTVAVSPVQPVTPQNQQTASVSSSASSRWIFWVILIVAVVLAVVLAIPRRKLVTTSSGTPQSPLPSEEEPQTIQSA